MTIQVIEIRKARNGFVISCIEDQVREYMPRGYSTYICGEDPADVAKAVEQALRETPITTEAVIPPARTLP